MKLKTAAKNAAVGSMQTTMPMIRKTTMILIKVFIFSVLAPVGAALSPENF